MRTFRPTYAVLPLALLLTGASDPTRFALPPSPPRFSPPHGEVMFSDDFSGDLSKWEADTSAAWTVWRRMLRADLPDQRQARAFLYAGSEDWRDYALDFDVCAMRGVDKGAAVRVQRETGFAMDLRGGTYQDVVAYLREWPLGKAPATNANGTWNHVRLEVQGNHFRVFVNDERKIDRFDQRRAKGRIALAAYSGGTGQCTVYYDNVVVTKLE
jgi:hypothetical protein